MEKDGEEMTLMENWNHQSAFYELHITLLKSGEELKLLRIVQKSFFAIATLGPHNLRTFSENVKAAVKKTESRR